MTVPLVAYYRILDGDDRDVTDASNPPRTLVAARRVAKRYGPGAVVLGARSQILFRVPEAKKARKK